jgi:hypothetical protein
MVATGGCHHAFYLVANEGLRKNIVTANIEHLGPQPFIGGSRGNDQLRRNGPAVQLMKNALPLPTRDFGVANDYLHLIPVQALQSAPAALGLNEPPPGLAKHVVQQKPLAFVLSYKQS